MRSLPVIQIRRRGLVLESNKAFAAKMVPIPLQYLQVTNLIQPESN